MLTQVTRGECGDPWLLRIRNKWLSACLNMIVHPLGDSGHSMEGDRGRMQEPEDGGKAVNTLLSKHDTTIVILNSWQLQLPAPGLC